MEELVRNGLRQLSAGARCIRERVGRGVLMGRAEGGWERVAEVDPVDGKPDAAEDRDAEGAAELGARLGDRRGGTGPFRWCCADDEVGCERADDAAADSHHQ